MSELARLALVGSILLPAVAAPALPAAGPSLRRAAIGASLLATLLAATAAAASPSPPTRLDDWLEGGPVATLGMLVFAAVASCALALAPSRHLDRPRAAAVLLMVAGTLLACAAGNPVMLLAGWTISALPFVVGPFVTPGNWRPRAALAASTGALALGTLLMITSDASHGLRSFAALAGTNAGGSIAFGCLAVAIVLRKGIVPAHAWVADVSETGALPTTLLVNGHLGAVVVARVIVPIFPHSAALSFVLLSNLALVTALYAAVRAVAEPAPRRLLALVVLSQSACILAGLESGTTEGTAGALLHLAVVALSTTALFGVLGAVEARTGEVDLTRYSGLAQAAPRLAVAFVVSALALVGVPGTLGFVAEELLVHGSLASQPQLGVLLPIATALNAVCLFRLFSRVFLGAARPPVTGVADALPRERWALTAIILVLVAGGVAPQAIVAWTGLADDARPHASGVSEASVTDAASGR